MQQTFYGLSCLSDLIIILFSFLPVRGKYFYSIHRHCANAQFENAYIAVMAILICHGIYSKTVLWGYPRSMERLIIYMALDILLLLAFFFYLFLRKPSACYRLTGFPEDREYLGIQQMEILVETRLTEAGYAKECYCLKNNGKEICFHGVSDTVVGQCMTEIDNYLEEQRLVQYKKFYYFVIILWICFLIYDFARLIYTFTQ